MNFLKWVFKNKDQFIFGVFVLCCLLTIIIGLTSCKFQGNIALQDTNLFGNETGEHRN